MSDDAPRSAQGNRPDQRRGRNAPAWWDMLQSAELPDDAVETGDLDPRARLRAARQGRAGRFPRLLSALSLVAAVLLALGVALAVWIGSAATGHSTGALEPVVVSLAGALVGATAISFVVARRRH